jgi:hypothetical protein
LSGEFLLRVFQREADAIGSVFRARRLAFRAPALNRLAAPTNMPLGRMRVASRSIPVDPEELVAYRIFVSVRAKT